MGMSLTYSIAYGLIAGIGTWAVVKGVAFILNVTFGIPDPTLLEEDIIDGTNEGEAKSKTNEEGEKDEHEKNKFMDDDLSLEADADKPNKAEGV